MCITCVDRHAPNSKFCPAALKMRNEQALRIVGYAGEGKQFREIAETEGIGVATAHKLFKVGMKLMAPPSVKMQLSILMLQLEQNYSDIRDALGTTNDPAEKAKLFAAANDNIARRQSLLGGPDVSIRHSGKIKADLKDLAMKFDEDQEVRNSSRARARRAER